MLAIGKIVRQIFVKISMSWKNIAMFFEGRPFHTMLSIVKILFRFAAPSCLKMVAGRNNLPSCHGSLTLQQLGAGIT